MTRQRKVNPRKMPTLLLALLLGATPLMAQPEATESSSASPSDGSANKPAATQQAPAPSEPEPKKSSSAGTSTSSPFDYRSSEKISEDVPVSFPVDI